MRKTTTPSALVKGVRVPAGQTPCVFEQMTLWGPPRALTQAEFRRAVRRLIDQRRAESTP